jgi:hypothetical protein
MHHRLKQDSPANWKRLWNSNPAVEKSGHQPIGWVLEAEGDIVGYIGSIPLRCFYGKTRLKVSATHGLVVQPEYRAYTGVLVSAYVRQKGVDLLVSTSAGEPAGKLFELFKGQLLPQADYNTALFWVLNAHGFVAMVQKKLRLNCPLANIGKHIGAELLRVEQLIRRRYPRARFQRCEIRELSPSAIGDDFDEFWRNKLAKSSRLMADRSAEALRWHFDIPGDQRRPVVLRCDYNGRLVGYAIVVTNVVEGMRKTSLVDMLVEDEESHVAPELLIAAIKYARRTSHDVFELVGFPNSIRRLCLAWNPYTRKHSSYFFKAADRSLHTALGSADAWYATPYDGDATLMPEYQPEKPVSANSYTLA